MIKLSSETVVITGLPIAGLAIYVAPYVLRENFRYVHWVQR